MGAPVEGPPTRWEDGDQPVLWEPSRRFLKFIILFTLAGATVYFVALFLVTPSQPYRAFVVGTLQALCLVSWAMHARGHIRLSVWLMSIGVWIYVTLTSVFFGGVSATVIALYVPVILLNGWLISDRAAVLAAALSVSTGLAMAVAEMTGHLPRAPVTPPLLRWLILACVFVVCATLMAFAARSYGSRLAEVRTLTAALATRTADLDRAQAVAHVGSWVYDLSADTMCPSPEACRVFGVPIGTIGNREMYRSLVFAADQAGVTRAWDAALASGAAFDHEHRILVGGAVRWVRQRAEFERQPDGSLRRAVGTTQDITERKQAEVALIESRNLLRAVIDTAPIRVFWKDRTSTYLGCNSAFARDAGALTPGDVVGKNDLELTWADQADTYRADDRRVMESAVPKLSYEEMQTTPDGRRIWLRTSKVPLRNDDGDVIGVVGIYDDVTERRRVESRLGMAIDVTGVALWELELPGGRLTFDRSSVPPLVGLEPDEVPEDLEGWIARVHPDDRQGLQARLAQAMAPGDPVFDFEYRVVSRTGDETWLHTRGRVVHRDDNGQPRLAIGTSMNVTPRRRIEEAIRASEERSRALASMLRRMCDNVPDMIWAKDLEGRYVFANRALSEGLLNAADTDEPLGKSDAFFGERERARHPGDPQWHTFAELNPDSGTLPPRDGVASTSEVSGYVKGRFITLDVRTSPFHDEYGRVIGTVGSARDITSRRQADEALRESESRMAAVFNASPVGIVISRVADARVIDANDTAIRMCGFRRDDIIGRTLQELHVYRSPEQRDEAVRLLSDTEAIDRRLVRLRAASGRFVETEVSVRAVALKGEPCLVTLMLDVTERRRLEEANLQAQKLASLGTLAGGIAHDFNNILQAIQGNAELAIELSEMQGPVTESLLEIRKASGRAAELVRRIMAFGRPREARKEIVDLCTATLEVLGLLRLTLPAEISIQTEFSAGHSNRARGRRPDPRDAGQPHDQRRPRHRPTRRDDHLRPRTGPGRRGARARHPWPAAWRRTRASRSRTRDAAWTPPPSRGCSTRSSRPRTWGRASGSGCRWCTESCAVTTARSRWRASPATARPSRSTSPPPRTPRPGRKASSRERVAGRPPGVCCSSTTSTRWCLWPPRCSRGWGTRSPPARIRARH